MAPDEQLAAYLAGDLPEPERVAFEAELLADETSRRELLAQRRISAGLHAMLGTDSQRMTQAILATLRGSGNSAIVRRVAASRPKVMTMPRPKAKPPGADSSTQGWWISLALAAAVAIAALLSWKQIFPTPPAPSATLARVMRAADAVWADAAAAPQPGRKLTAGSLRLKSGAVEIEFSRGALAVIEGPAELQLVSDNEGRLASGKLWARVPPSAHGFTVRGRGFTAVDLGTEFGCNVPPSGAAEVHVFDGAVDVNSRRLRENQALELAATPREIPAQRSAFIGAEQMPQRTAFLRGSRTEQDIGNPGRRGSTTLDARTGVWTVAGGGADIFGTSDQFHFVSEEFGGDGAFIAKVVSIGKSDDYSKAGLMLRASMRPDAAYAYVFVGPSTIGFEFRTGQGRVAANAPYAGYRSAPMWIQLVRRGEVVTASYSETGTQWTQLGGGQTVPFPASMRAGLAVTAHNNASLNRAVFESVTAQSSARPER